MQAQATGKQPVIGHVLEYIAAVAPVATMQRATSSVQRRDRAWV
jgi:hypothetical protein